MQSVSHSAIGKRLGIGMLALSSIVVAVLYLGSSLSAASNPTLKLQVAAIECTLDTVDDGSGPVQVITCPPGVIDPDEDEDDIVVGDIDGSNAKGANPQISQRLQSPADTFTLLDILRDPGLKLDPLEYKVATQEVVDLVPREDNRPNFVQSFVTVSLIVVLTTVAAAFVFRGTHVRKSIVRLIRRR